MKNLLKGLLSLALLSMVLVGCNKDDDEDKTPKLSSPIAKYIGEDFATITAEVLDDAELVVREKGICWNTATNPTVDDNKVEYEKSYDQFQCEIEDLTKGTTYYAKAYVRTDDDKITYSSEVTFTTTEPVVDEDGNSYKTVIIGSQTWMAENLRTTKYNDGESIPNVTDEDTWSELETPAYSWWENDNTKTDRGAYYNYYTVLTEKLAPTGWHVPTEEEWNTLIEFVGEKPGDKLKAGSFSDRYFNGNAETHFYAWLEGYRASGSGTFGRGGEWVFYWYLDKTTSDYTYAMRMEDDKPDVKKDFNSMQMGFHVRCIKD